jgi:hypothetical protein
MMIHVARHVALLALLSGVAGDPCEALCSMRDPPIRTHGCCAASSQRLQPSCCQEGPAQRPVGSLVGSVANVLPWTVSSVPPDALHRGIDAPSFGRRQPCRPLVVLRI